MRALRRGGLVVLVASGLVGGPAHPSDGTGRTPVRAALVLRADEQWRAGDFAAAARSVDAALAQDRGSPDPALQALAFNVRANILDSQGDPEGPEWHRRALARAVEARDRGLQGRILADAGRGHWTRAEYDQATETCERALAVQQEIGDRAGEAVTLGYLGRIAYKQARYASARDLYERGLGLQRSLGDRRAEAVTLEDLAALAQERGEYAEALERRQRELEIFQALGDAAGRGRVLAANGYLYELQGADGEALEHYRLALRLADQAGDRPGRGSALSKLGGGYAHRGAYGRALEHYNASVTVRREIADRRELGWLLARTARVHALAGGYAEALKLYAQAIALCEQIQDRRALGYHLLALGRLQERLGRRSEARHSYERALEIAERIRLPSLSRVLGRLGLLAAREGAISAALEQGQRAVMYADATGNLDLRWAARADLGSIQAALGQREEAIATLRESLALLEEMRAGVAPSDEPKAGWIENKQEVYARAAGLLVDAGRPEEALEVAERARARALLDLLGARVRGLGRPRPGSAEGARGRAHVPSPAAVEPLGAEALRDQARRRGATLLEYLVAEDRALVWVVRPDGAIHATSVAVAKSDLARLVDEMRRATGADAGSRQWEDEERGAEGVKPAPPEPPGAPTDGDAALRRLHRLLIEPVRAHLPGSPDELLTIVPHGPLFLVSFAALRDAQGRYLVERHTLGYSPAISVLGYTGETRLAAGPPRVLVVGNPAMPRLPGRRGPLVALPGAEAEARAIGRLFPRDAVTVLVGAAANEDRVRALAPGHTVLHFATHGIVRDDAPLESLLALAPARAGAREADGLWTAREILDLELRADLVTLSGCQTGLGRVSGDGVLGLSRAFLSAGAPTLVVSLWRVADEVARDQMARFYRELARDGRGKAAALRRSQLDTIARLRRGELRTRSGRPLPEKPVFWAPFVLLGEAR